LSQEPVKMTWSTYNRSEKYECQMTDVLQLWSWRVRAATPTHFTLGRLNFLCEYSQTNLWWLYRVMVDS
jgi:hypothetical protein